MAPANLKGPNQPSLNTPSELTKQTIMLAMHQGSAVIDLRTRALYASEHLMGTYNIELSNDLTTYAGWLIGWDVPIIIIGLRVEDVQSAQGKLSLIGRDVIGGYSTTEPILDDPTTNSSYPIKTFADLSQIEDRSTVTIVDVRRNAEWNIDHIDGAIHIPLHTLESNISKVPDDKPVWVHCMSGFRASIAASILDSTKKQVVLINDNYSNAIKAGITIKKEEI
jgi:hydroxyacylglutathione hydrolase